MKTTEAHRRLGRAGWIKIRDTARGHEVWRSPNGKLKTLSLSNVEWNRDQAALIRQAERAAASMKGDRLMEVRVPETMTSAAALASAPRADAGKPREWAFKVYRTPDTVKSSFVELAFGEAELEHLGGAGTRVSVELDAEGHWTIQGGGFLLVKAEGVGRYKVKTTAMTDALPHTGRTPIPVELRANGFRLFPDAVTVAKPQHKAKGVSDAEVPHLLKRLHQELSQPAEAEPTKLPAGGRPVTAPEPTSSPGGASTAQESASIDRPTDEEVFRAMHPTAKAMEQGLTPSKAEVVEQQASLERFGTSFAAGRPVVPTPPKRAWSIDDLREAMKMLRDVVGELGVTLYGANGLSIQLDDIEFRGRV